MKASWYRPAVIALSMAVIAAMSEVPVFAHAAAQPAVQAAKPKPKQACPASRPDRLSAAVAARLCGGRVEVAGDTTETTRVWAEANSSFTAEQSAGAERFRRNGQWVDIDLRLTRSANGTVMPQAHPHGLVLAGAAGPGPKRLVALGDGERQMTLDFTAALSEPVLDGSTATYQNVYPGVDMIVEALVNGYEQSFVVRERAGLAGVRGLLEALRVNGPGAADDGAGGLVFKDKAGAAVGRMPAPLMWDSAGSGGGQARRKLDVTTGTAREGGRRDIGLRADDKWLADPARVFPITIDPGTIVQTTSFDTYVASGTTTDLSTSSKLALGTQNSGSTKRIAYLNFTAQGLAGSHINWATLKLWSTVAANCDPGVYAVFGTTTNASTSTRWTSRPNLIDRYGNNVGQDGTGDAAFGGSLASDFGACTGGWLQADATGLWQYAANNGWWAFTTALTPYWDDTNSYYKEFKSAETGTTPHVTLNWNEPPTVSGPATSPATAACTTGAGRPWMTSKTPWLYTTVNDSDGASSNVAFEWWTGGSKVGGTTVNNVAAGSVAQARIPDGALAEGGVYSWRAQAVDAGGLASSWTPWCEFTVDTVKPAVPFVATKDGVYPSIVVQNTWGHGGYGQAGTFTLTPAAGTSDLASFSYQLDTQSTATTVSATGATDITVTPTEDGVRTLTVYAKDSAGNVSGAAAYVFNVGRAGLVQPLPGANVVKRTKLAVVGDSVYTRVRYQYRRGPGALEQDIPWANLTTAAGQPIAGATGSPLPLTDLGAHTVWNALDTLGAVGGVAQLRAKLYTASGPVSDGAIHNAASGRCLDAVGYGTANNTPIQLWDCTGAGNQRFELGADGLIRNPASGRCLNIEGGAPYANGQRIILFDCSVTSANEKWQLLPDGSVKNPDSGRCLDLTGGGTANGTVLQSFTCTGGVNQQFTGVDTAYATQWITVNVDPNGDGAASATAGPGSVNLLTGDHTLTAQDVDEFGMTVGRTASSRDSGSGWVPQAERFSGNQQQVSTDLTGFAGESATLVRTTAFGQGGSLDALELTPTSATGDSFATVGGSYGAMNLGMKAGHRYRLTGWIYVPAATGLAAPNQPGRAERLMVFTNTPGGYQSFASAPAAFVDAWQQLSVDFTVPVNATDAFVRLYNGQTSATGKKVYFDNLSLKELLAPFGPQWRGGAADPVVQVDYTSLEFPSADVAAVNLAQGGQVTFGRSAGDQFFPEPGAETLSLKKIDGTHYQLSEVDGTVVEFSPQSGSVKLTVSATWDESAKADSTTRYVYDVTDGRSLITRIIAPVDPDLGDCKAATPARGCQTLDFDYAPSTTATAAVFGDFQNQVRTIRLWSWDPQAAGGAGAMASVEVARYAYDDLGRLREVYDPRVTPVLKTQYAYDSAGHVIQQTPAGQLPWRFEYGTITPSATALVGAPALAWPMDEGTGTTLADASGHGRNGVVANGSWTGGAGSNEPSDKATAYNGTSTVVSGPSGLLNTAQSYTVSAWARLDSDSNWACVVSQDGNRVSAFTLQFDSVAKKWSFSGNAADADNTTATRTYSKQAPVTGQWTHLTGVHDASAHQLRLYVNGRLEASSAYTGWAAPGSFVSGRDKWNGSPAGLFPGAIDDVLAYDGVLTDGQIGQLASQHYVDGNGGRLLRTIRASLQQGSKTVTGPDNATRVVYGVPLTRAGGGPNDLDSSTAGTWGQTDLPSDATAVFGPQDDPQTTTASATVPGRDGYQYATVHYLNASGYEVNTAAPAAAGLVGGAVDTVQYDRFGHTVWTLEATNRLLALGTLPGASTTLGDLGLSTLDTAARADLLASTSTYSADGVDLLEETGPTVKTVLEAAYGVQPAGSVVQGRRHTVYRYDEGKPDGAAYHLVTSDSEGLAVAGTAAGAPDADVRVTRKEYDAVNGSASGWVLKQATKVISDAGGANLAAYAVYDSSGKVLKSWGVGATGSDAATKETIYYTVGANAADSACGNRPEWAGKPCLTRPAGTVSGHDPARAPGTLPTRRVTGYSRFGDPTTVTESNAGKTRTTVTTYDAAGRAQRVALTSDDGAAQIPEAVTAYDSTTGLPLSVTAGTATTVREYDLLGRTVKYTDADGSATTSEYDRYGRPARTVDPTGTVTYGYDRASEPRGMVTSLTDSAIGTFTAAYSPDGQLTTVGYPGGITRQDTLDAALEPVARAYTRTSDGAPVYTESVQLNAHRQYAVATATGHTKSYQYDRLGRLTKVRDTAGADPGQCITRAYEYTGSTGDRSNRTAFKRWQPSASGACDESSTPELTSYTYDSADRLASDSSGSYTYDAFGRTTLLPSGLATSFFVNDMVAAQTFGTERQDWTLDPANRLRAFTTATYNGTSWIPTGTKVNHYDGDDDQPRWIQESAGTWTRNVSGPDGDLAATVTGAGVKTISGTSLHGDVVFSLDVDAPAAVTLYDYDEFGNKTGADPGRYAWLGGKQRSAEALGGVVLMGARLYSPSLGRFLSVDPQDGGSCNAYDYVCQDPVNSFDLDGRSLWSNITSVAKVVAPIASLAAMIPGPIGTAAAVVSAGAYLLAGDRKQAAIMAGAAALAMVGAGVVAVGAAKLATKMPTLVRGASAVAKGLSTVGGRALAAAGRAVGSKAAAVGQYIRNGQNFLRIGRSTAGAPFRISLGPAPKHFGTLGRIGKALNPIHVHLEWRKVGIDFNWLRKSFYKKW